MVPSNIKYSVILNELLTELLLNSRINGYLNVHVWETAYKRATIKFYSPLKARGIWFDFTFNFHFSSIKHMSYSTNFG